MTAWLQTRSGLAFDFEDPRPEQINIGDIAHALGHLCRFAGHASRFYSVAEHSVHCARFLNEPDGTKDFARWGLMHDAHEAYVVDIPSPLKRLLPDYQHIENLAEIAVRTRFGLFGVMPSPVRNTDVAILREEAKALHCEPPRPWNLPESKWLFECAHEHWAQWTPECWPAPEASARFLEMFRELFPEVTP